MGQKSPQNHGGRPLDPYPYTQSARRDGRAPTRDQRHRHRFAGRDQTVSRPAHPERGEIHFRPDRYTPRKNRDDGFQTRHLYHPGPGNPLVEYPGEPAGNRPDTGTNLDGTSRGNAANPGNTRPNRGSVQAIQDHGNPKRGPTRHGFPNKRAMVLAGVAVWFWLDKHGPSLVVEQALQP